MWGDWLNFDYTTVGKSYFYSLIKPFLWIASHVVYKYRCEGRKNIPTEGSLIIACNHVAFSDPALIIVNCPRKIYYMAKSELFENKAFAVLLKNMNAFPVRRWSADRNALKYAVKVLRKGEVLGIFPEGRRVRGGAKPVEARKGIGYIARISHSDILPCCIFKINKRFRSEIRLVYGEVIKNKDIFPAVNNLSASEESEIAASIIMNRIKDLWLIQERKFKQQEPLDSASE